MIGYRARIEKDLARWEMAGLVTKSNAHAMRADLDSNASGFGFAPVLSILGAVLVCFGAMTFVAANWQSMSKLLRLGLLFGAMWAAYGGAWLLRARALPAFSEAAILIGIGVYGASIMLIAQMYHLDGHPPDAVLWWALGAFAAGLALQSRAALAATVVLFAVWSGWETGIDSRVHWPFLIAWLATTAAILMQGWRAGLHPSALSLAAWTVLLGYVLDAQAQRHLLVVLIGLIWAGLALWRRPMIERLTGFGNAAPAYGFAVAFSGLYSLQFIHRFWGADRYATVIAGLHVPLFVLAIAALALLFAMLFIGSRTGNRPLMWLGYVGFSIEVLSLYFRTIGSLLGTSFFFLTTGVLVIGLSWLAWWLHKRQGPAGSTLAEVAS